MTTTEIRLGAAADVAPVLALWARADAVPSVTDDEMNVQRAVDHGALLVAGESERIVGTLIVGFDGWRGNMYRLAVDPDCRRRGIARALVADGERRLAARGCRRITALVVAEEDHATSFWGAAGYELDQRIARFVKTTRV